MDGQTDGGTDIKIPPVFYRTLSSFGAEAQKLASGMQRWPQKSIFGLRVADLVSGLQIWPQGCRSCLGDADLALEI